MNTNGFIKIPNSVVGNIKGYRCMLYIYLLYLCTVQNKKSVKVKLETCRNCVGIAFTSTVCNQLRALEKAGYISIEHNYSCFGLQTCNTVTVKGFNPQKDYFLLPSEYIQKEIPPSAFELMLTLYMYSFQNPFCYPSFSQIKKLCHLGGSTIVQGYKILEEKNVISKENYMRADGSNGHNRYFLVKKIEKLIGEERTAQFLIWIRKQKTICCGLWQIIKEVLTGNIGILNEICAEIVKNDTYTGDEYEDFEADDSVDNCVYFENNMICIDRKRGAWGFIKEKISQIREEIGLIFGKIFQKFKRVIL